MEWELSFGEVVLKNPSKVFIHRHRQTYFKSYVERQGPKIAQATLTKKNQVGGDTT